MESIMLNDMRNGQYYYDYLHGGLGIAQYFISCNRFDSLSLLVDKLEQTAIFDFETKGLKWKTNTKHIEFYVLLKTGLETLQKSAFLKWAQKV